MFPFFRKTLPETLNPTSCFAVNWVERHGTCYSPRMALIVGVEDGAPVFAQILLLVCLDELACNVLFICERLSSIGFDEHVHGYHVVLKNSHVCVTFDDLVDPFPIFVSETFNDRSKRVILRSRM